MMTRGRLFRALSVCVLTLGLSTPSDAQSTLIDLRPADISSEGDVTYQNFIVSHLLADGKVIVEGLFLRIPGTDYPDYNELSFGGGYRVVKYGGMSVYGMVHFAKATDVTWFQPAALMTFASGKWAANAFGQRYVSLTEDYPSAWLLDPAELQYTVAGPFAIGVSAYIFKQDDTSALKKFGPKFSVADKYGATELRTARVNQGAQWEFQLRRIFLF